MKDVMRWSLFILGKLMVIISAMLCSEQIITEDVAVSLMTLGFLLITMMFAWTDALYAEAKNSTPNIRLLDAYEESQRQLSQAKYELFLHKQDNETTVLKKMATDEDIERMMNDEE